MRPVRVLIVDDSATMRSIIARTLESDPQIQVVGRAADPLEARSAVKALDPDVITLDVEMPNMNGIDFLEKIMRLRPTPVIMVSNLTGTGAAATLRALEIGAFDCVAKPTVGEAAPFAELPGKVKAAAEARTKPAFAARKPDVAGAKTATAAYRSDGRVVAIGSSTGGVEALLTVLADFPANCPPTVITQHMPATFTRSFADRLDRATAATVTEAADGDFLQPGHIYLAPGGGRHFEVIGAERPRCRLLSGDPVNGHRPSVDVLFRSVAKTCGARSVGVILTGMGRDGADGLREMAAAGAMTLGQDAGTSLVYGMPKVAFDIGAVAKQLPLQKIGPEILNVTRALERQ